MSQRTDTNFRTRRSTRKVDRFAVRVAVRGRRGGFTLVELFLGMVVTALVLGGVAAFATAVNATWKNSESTRSAVLSGSQVDHHVADIIRRARYVLYTRAGTPANPAAVLLWDHDGDVATGVAANGSVQFSELLMLKYNPTDKTLDLYSPPSPIALDSTWAYSLLSTSAGVTSFQAAGATAVPIARKVTAATFSTSGATGAVSYTLTYDRSETGQVESTTVALRFPGTTPP